jgi:hypothetical protein
MFEWFKRRDQNVANPNEPMVTVFLNPLMMLLAGAERHKGSPLTEAEVLYVRDTAVCVQMTQSQANKFYQSLDSQMPIPRLNPESIWDEWQAVRDKIQ